MKRTLKISQGSSPVSVNEALAVVDMLAAEVGVDVSTGYNTDGASLCTVDVVDVESFALLGAVYTAAKQFGMNVEEV